MLGLALKIKGEKEKNCRPIVVVSLKNKSLIGIACYTMDKKQQQHQKMSNLH